MAFILWLDTSNSAFDDPTAEIARILREVAAEIEEFATDDHFSLDLRDMNGNTVGFFEYRPRDYQPFWRTLNESQQEALAIAQIEEIRDDAKGYAHEQLDALDADSVRSFLAGWVEGDELGDEWEWVEDPVDGTAPHFRHKETSERKELEHVITNPHPVEEDEE